MTTAAVDPTPDPVPVLTRKLQQLADTFPALYAELFPTKEKP